MKGKCIDIGTVQAFLDGELLTDQSLRVSHHVAECDACARLLSVAEDESAVVFPVLERELNTLVPTQRLWTKINESIETEKEQRPFWSKIWSAIALQILSPSLAGAASLVIVLGIVAVVWNSRSSHVETVQPSPAAVAVSQSPAADQFALPSKEAAPVPATSATNVKYVASRRERQAAAIPTVHRVPEAVTNTLPKNSLTASTGYLPGEESYVKTIANLSQTVSGQKDAVMRPSERIAFERDMAVVDDSIKRMRSEVRKNPANESAKQVLYTSYQNKIDLLNSVSQKEELIASIR